MQVPRCHQAHAIGDPKGRFEAKGVQLHMAQAINGTASKPCGKGTSSQALRSSMRFLRSQSVARKRMLQRRVHTLIWQLQNQKQKVPQCLTVTMWR